MYVSFIGAGKMVAWRFPVLLFLSMFTGAVACVTTESLARASASEESTADTLAWQEIPSSDMTSVIQLLSAQTRSNYEKIRTWQGTIHRKFSMDLSKSQAIDNKASLANTPVQEVHQKTLHFVIDLLSDKRFVSIEDSQVSWIERRTGRLIPVENRSVVDERLIHTQGLCSLSTKPIASDLQGRSR